MRVLVFALIALFIAGCATVPASTTTVYDHKYNTYSFLKSLPQSEFVGTSAGASKATPSWAPANTTPVLDRKYNTYSYVPKQ